MKKLIISDLDGTMYSKKTTYFLQVRQNIKKTVSEYLKRLGPELDSGLTYSKLPKSFPNVLDLCHTVDIPVSTFAEVYTNINIQNVKNDQRLGELIKKTEASIWIVTYAPATYTLAICKKLGVDRSISGIFSLENFENEIGYPYKKIIAYEKIIKSVGADDRTIFVIGDTWDVDIKDAHLQNLKTILISELTLSLVKTPSGIVLAPNIYEGLKYVCKYETGH